MQLSGRAYPPGVQNAQVSPLSHRGLCHLPCPEDAPQRLVDLNPAAPYVLPGGDTPPLCEGHECDSEECTQEHTRGSEEEVLSGKVRWSRAHPARGPLRRFGSDESRHREPFAPWQRDRRRLVPPSLNRHLLGSVWKHVIQSSCPTIKLPQRVPLTYHLGICAPFFSFGFREKMRYAIWRSSIGARLVAVAPMLIYAIGFALVTCTAVRMWHDAEILLPPARCGQQDFRITVLSWPLRCGGVRCTLRVRSPTWPFAVTAISVNRCPSATSQRATTARHEPGAAWLPSIATSDVSSSGYRLRLTKPHIRVSRNFKLTPIMT
mmetsp:Transcript_10461/g.25193  ORF Transcript_10461/g.25193 Transcript_10461/m.25193 type:complete len:320 (-) Transcript_10461:2-961(-)